MWVALALATSTLLGIVSWGLGGYAPWSMITLEIGSLLLFAAVLLHSLYSTSREERLRNLALQRSTEPALWRRLPLLGALFGGLFARGDVEIWTPSSKDGVPTLRPSGGPFRESVYFMGYPFRGHGLGLIAILLTLWIGCSLVPLSPSWLDTLSPVAFELRSELAYLNLGNLSASQPWSVAPFLSFQSLWLWLCYCMIFTTTYRLAASSEAVRWLSGSLMLLGVFSGGYGLIQWLTALSASMGDMSLSSALRATGSFGNRNHYAAFQEMLLFVSLGWVSSEWLRLTARSGTRGDRVRRQEAQARNVILLFACAIIALGLLFSLSRSGIVFGILGGVVFLFLTRPPAPLEAREGLAAAEGPRAAPRDSRRIYAMATMVGAAAILWIGVDPIVSRFQLMPEELAAESGRAQVWKDSLPAIADFWLTGSGLDSFQYVYPMYRSFGGRRFYSWAHNDYLQLTIELGLTGLALALILIVLLFRRAAKRRREHGQSATFRHLHAGYCAAAVAMGLHSFTDFGLHLPANAALLAAILAVAIGLAPVRRRRNKTAMKESSPRKTLRRSPPRSG